MDALRFAKGDIKTADIRGNLQRTMQNDAAVFRTAVSLPRVTGCLYTPALLGMVQRGGVRVPRVQGGCCVAYSEDSLCLLARLAQSSPVHALLSLSAARACTASPKGTR